MEAREIPGPRAPAVLGGLRFAYNPLGYIRWLHRRYGAIGRVRFPGFGLLVYVAEPDLIRQVFTGDPAIYHSGESSATVLEPTVGTSSVLTLDDAPHMRQRKLLLPPFHGDNVRRWETTIRSVTEQDMRSWPVDRPFRLHPCTRRITLDVILRAVFGVRDAAHMEQARALIEEFARRAHPITVFRVARRDLGPASPWARFVRARKALDAFLYEEIERRRGEPDVAERDDVLSLLLCATDETGAPMSRQELRDELVTVVGAGHETTATALAWAFERLLRTPAVLDRLTRSLADGDDYLEATIKETLRIRPVITDVGRKLTRDIELGPYRIPAGAIVMPGIVGLHFREDLYPGPEEFRPERFLDQTPAPYTWIPFGGGIRRCIGATFAQFEMRVIMRTILERARLRAASARPERPKLRNITSAPQRGCRVVLERPLAPPARQEDSGRSQRTISAAGSASDSG